MAIQCDDLEGANAWRFHLSTNSSYKPHRLADLTSRTTITNYDQISFPPGTCFCFMVPGKLTKISQHPLKKIKIFGLCA